MVRYKTDSVAFAVVKKLVSVMYVITCVDCLLNGPISVDAFQYGLYSYVI